MSLLQVYVVVKTENPLNGSHLHWRTVARRRKAQRRSVAQEFEAMRLISKPWAADLERVRALLLVEQRPLLIELTRRSAGELDDDAVGAALKSVRDQVAAILGVENDRDPRYRWTYRQEKSRRGVFGVNIEISEDLSKSTNPQFRLDPNSPTR